MARSTPFPRLPIPRLLPLTILAMVALLSVKSGHLVMAAAGEPPSSPAPSAPSAAERAPADPTPADPTPAGEKPALPDERPVSGSERALLTDLRRRRQQLDAREAALAARETTLAAVEKRLDLRLAELAALQARLEALEQQRQGRDEANWRGLVKVYEAMKPRDAAAIFNDLDLPVLLPVLDRMKETKTAPILAAMQAERARLVTTELAQLRAKANSTTAKSGGGD
jgi:flagellar motility protein MotE (MotC chaperone)